MLLAERGILLCHPTQCHQHHRSQTMHSVGRLSSTCCGSLRRLQTIVNSPTSRCSSSDRTTMPSSSWALALKVGCVSPTPLCACTGHRVSGERDGRSPVDPDSPGSEESRNSQNRISAFWKHTVKSTVKSLNKTASSITNLGVIISHKGSPSAAPGAGTPTPHHAHATLITVMHRGTCDPHTARPLYPPHHLLTRPANGCRRPDRCRANHWGGVALGMAPASHVIPQYQPQGGGCVGVRCPSSRQRVSRRKLVYAAHRRAACAAADWGCVHARYMCMQAHTHVMVMVVISVLRLQ